MARTSAPAPGAPATISGITFVAERQLNGLKRQASGSNQTGILTQLGWTPENVGQLVRKTGDAEVTITTTGSFAPSFILNILASRPASIVNPWVALAKSLYTPTVRPAALMPVAMLAVEPGTVRMR